MCTTAERGYALEAWRVLDSNNNLIAPELRRERIVTVNSRTKKSVAAVLQPGLTAMGDDSGERARPGRGQAQAALHLLPAASYRALQSAACCLLPAA